MTSDTGARPLDPLVRIGPVHRKVECDLDSSVPEWVIEHPETLAMFQELGIDYCCGGKSLEFACRERGLDPILVLSRIRRNIEAGSP